MNARLLACAGLALAIALAGCKSGGDASAPAQSDPALAPGQKAPEVPRRDFPPPPPPPGPQGGRVDASPPPAPSTTTVDASARVTPVVSELIEVFPGVRARVNGKHVEFDATTATIAHDPATPRVYLELVACTPDSREHESLLVTKAKPSHIHAAMIASGFVCGVPGSWKFEDNQLIDVPPTGDRVRVEFVWSDAAGTNRTAEPAMWIVRAGDEKTAFPSAAPSPSPGWVFAGSVQTRRQAVTHYDADMSGTLIGLTTFGGETIAWSEVISPEASIRAPEWIINTREYPAFGTPVIVRITAG